MEAVANNDTRAPSDDARALALFRVQATKVALTVFCQLSSEDRQALVAMLQEYLQAPDGETRNEVFQSIIEFTTPVGELYDLDEVVSLDEWVNGSAELRSAAEALAKNKTGFAARVRTLMEKLGVNQSDLASKLGVTQPTISQIIGGKHKPQPKTLERLAEALSTSVEALWPDD